MSNALQINGRTLHSIKDAVEVVSYSRDYITRLAREEKIVAALIGRQWFVDIDSLKSYTEVSAMEQELRKKLLSEERKKERQLREAADRQNTLHIKKEKASHYGAAVAACLILGLGLLGGWAADFLISPQQKSSPVNTFNLAQVNRTQVTDVVSANQVPTIAQVETAPAQPVFSNPEVQPLEGIENGILLLPQATSSEVSDLFSDRVVIKQLPSGEQVAVRVDKDGKEYGNPIPFVEVPVNQARDTYE